MNRQTSVAPVAIPLYVVFGRSSFQGYVDAIRGVSAEMRDSLESFLRISVHDLKRWHAFHALAVPRGRLSAEDVFMSVVPAPFGFGLWTSHVTPALLDAMVANRPVVVPHRAPLREDPQTLSVQHLDRVSSPEGRGRERF